MTAYAGRIMTLKAGTWAGGTTITQVRDVTVSIDHEIVDRTTKDSNGFREILEGAGTKSLVITFNGLVDNSAVFESFLNAANSGSTGTYAVGGIADGDVWEGSFNVSASEISGGFNNEQTFSATLNSSGAWTFTQA